MSKLLIFTDLDGTLLDHDSYSYEPARATLERLRELDIPIIINSSKTAAEIIALREELNNNHPFIVENGAAVCLPPGYFVSSESCGQPETVHNFGPDYGDLCEILEKIRSHRGWHFRGFADMSVAELAELTGLNQVQADLAKQRHSSEPILWQDTEQALETFSAELAEHELTTVRGGRFIHVMGHIDKALAMTWLLQRYRQAWPDTDWRTVALGDSANDQKMLESADIAAIIPTDKGPALNLDKTENVLRPANKGPAGWRDAMNEILKRNL